MAIRQLIKGSEMHDAKADGNPGAVDAAPAHTLDELRVVQHDYAASGGISAKGRWALIAVIVIAVGAGVAWKLRADAAKAVSTVGAVSAAAGPIFSTPLPATAGRSMADVAAATVPLSKLDAVAPAARTQRVAHQRVAQTSPAKAGQSAIATGDSLIASRAAPMPSPAFSAPAVTPLPEVQSTVITPVVEDRPVALPAVAALAAPSAEPASQ
jgi:hypothetical protein